MSVTLDLPGRRQEVSAPTRLQTEMAAARVSFTWFGTRRALTAEQRAEAADAFGAEGPFLSAGKKLIDTRDERFKAVTAVRNRTVAYWRSVSLPYPEPGIRLIRQDDIVAFSVQMTNCRQALASAVTELDTRFESLKQAARHRLGRLFNASDYPASLIPLFELNWDFPSVEPPEYLRQLNPALYREECERMQARFGEALRLAEEAFVSELSGLVGHLVERLTGTDDGRPKIFRDTAVGNLQEFFARFQALNIGSNAQLDELVTQCQQIVRGVDPQQLRDNTPLRQRVAEQLTQVETVLDTLWVERPRRRVLRQPQGRE
jgi:hypothetical protein